MISSSSNDYQSTACLSGNPDNPLPQNARPSRMAARRLQLQPPLTDRHVEFAELLDQPASNNKDSQHSRLTTCGGKEEEKLRRWTCDMKQTVNMISVTDFISAPNTIWLVLTSQRGLVTFHRARHMTCDIQTKPVVGFFFFWQKTFIIKRERNLGLRNTSTVFPSSHSCGDHNVFRAAEKRAVVPSLRHSSVHSCLSFTVMATLAP